MMKSKKSTKNKKDNFKPQIADLTDIFGALKRKMSGQDFKDMVREGWD